MTIESHDEVGFVVSATKDGNEIGREQFNYELFATMPDALTSLGRAAIRNGVSQWLGDVGAGKDEAAYKKAFAAKVARIREGIAPREGGRNHPLFEIVFGFLKGRGQKDKEAREMAKDPKAVADSIGEAMEKHDPAKYSAETVASKLLAAWQAEYDRRKEAADLTKLLA